MLAAIWLFGLAKLLNAIGKRGLAIGAAVLAIIWTIQFIAWHLEASQVSDAALAIVVLLSPPWAAWLGITLLRLRFDTEADSTNREQLA
jgi:hypothetical protein